MRVVAAGEALLAPTVTRRLIADTVTTIEGPLTEAVTERCQGMDRLTAHVLSASAGAAAKVALRQWLRSTSVPASMNGFVVPSGSLPDLVRTALMPLAPALDAAATRSPH